MADRIYWIWLQEALGIGNVKTDRVIREIGSPEALYRMSARELSATGIFAPKEIEKIKATTLEHAKENLLRAKKHQCAVITPDHPDYPSNLTNIDCMPCVLYVRGDLSGIDGELVITMVGTRESDQYGETCAAKLSYDLAVAGCTIASGLAVGIDCACHEGALRAQGRTIGLLACGMDIDYPQASHGLKRSILENGGVLISEFPFGEAPRRYNFHIRNRLLSGIASGVVVVQAPEQSGALITANHALRQNRDVFAVPGGIFDAKMTGCNRLIKDGAKIVVNVYSILEEYINKFPEKMDPKSIVRRLRAVSAPMQTQQVNFPRKIARPAGSGREELLMVAQEAAAPVKRIVKAELDARAVSMPAQRIYELLGREPADGDWIVGRTGFSAMECMVALTELELQDLVKVLPGKRYVIREPESD